MRKELTFEQARAAHSNDVATAVLAGAGSGKTTVLVERFVTLLERGLRPQEILTVTFTTDAADQLKERIQSALTDETLRTAVGNSPYIGTIHGFCYRILDQYGSLLGLEPVRKIVTSLDWAASFQSGYSEWLRDVSPDSLRALLKHYLPGDLRDLVRAFYRQRHFFVGELESHLSVLDPVEKEIFTLLHETTSPLFKKLDQNFQNRGWYTFDDLEHLTLRILQKSPETIEKLRVDLKAVLIDEFQDTSPLQWQILEPLVRQDPKRLFVVGDPKQSIYSFRDADVALFLRTCDSIAKNHGLVQELSVNFRTVETTLSPINAFSAKLFEHSSIPFAPMTSGAKVLDGGVGYLRYPTGEARLKSELPREEAAFVAQEIKRRVESGVSPSEFALLFRAAERMGEFASALAKLGISSQSQSSDRLGDHYSAWDLLHFLKSLKNPLDDFSLGGFLRSPYVGLSYSDVVELLPPKGTTLFQRLETAALPGTQWFLDFISTKSTNFDDAMDALFRNTGKTPEPDSVLFTLYKTLAEYRDLDVNLASDLIEAGIRENILLEGAPTRESNSVNLMTIHAAKGLEYGHVFLVDLLRIPPRNSPLIRTVAGYPPGLKYRGAEDWQSSNHYDSLDTYFAQREEQESKRILYVAMTRAIQTLTISLPWDEKWIPKDSWAQEFTTTGKDANDSSM